MKEEGAITFLILGSTVVAMLRFAIPGHDLSLSGTYEAFAHIWVGFMLGVMAFVPSCRWLAGGLLLAITALETVMFLAR
jgi:hypothetical protein